MSKVLIKRTFHKDDPDAFELGVYINPCETPSLHWNLNIEINSSAGTILKYIGLPTNAWDLTKCTLTPNNEKASLNTGDCEVHYKSVVDSSGNISGKLAVKCLLVGAVGTIQSVIVHIQLPETNISDDMCFLNGASGYSSAATVKKDGSDGKSIKMLNAPLTACEDNGFY